MVKTQPSLKKRKVLLLNASEEVISFIDWKKAVILLCSGKARKPFNYEGEYQIKTVCGVFKLPFAIMLVEYVHSPHRKAKLTRENIFRRDNFSCQYCGCLLNARNATIDHVLPMSRGGGDSWENMVASCRDCNVRKSNRTPKEARMKMLNNPVSPCGHALVMTILDEETKKVWGRWLV